MQQTKLISVPVEYKDGANDAGEVVARFSVFDIVDRDGDILRRSAFTDGQEVPMVWAHRWDQPVGKGVIHVKADHAEFAGQFLTTTAAQEARKTVREMGDLQQWSFGFRITDTQDNTQIRGLDITGAQVFEVSPVLVGANQETATLAVKSADPAEPEPERDPALVEIADEAARLVEATTTEDVASGLRELAALVEVALKGIPEDAATVIERERLALEALELEAA